jgi:TPR repeat protein
MKRTICRLFYGCLLASSLCACAEVPTIAPPPSIVGLDQRLKWVTLGNVTAQTALAESFLRTSDGLGRDEQTALRFLYGAADHGDAKAQQLLEAIGSAGPTIDIKNDWMEHAYWAYRLAMDGNGLAMSRLGSLYARPDFPAYDLIESCKWKLLWMEKIKVRLFWTPKLSFKRATCDPKQYNDEVFQQASQRAQSLFQQIPVKP